MKPYALRSLLVLATLLVVMPASAQYVWLDENGRKQYSDMPPPMSVPQARILKQPGMKAPSTAEQPATPKEATKAATGAEAPSAPPTLAEQEVEFRKRRAEKAENEKKRRRKRAWQRKTRKTANACATTIARLNPANAWCDGTPRENVNSLATRNARGISRKPNVHLRSASN